jgi:arylsulfatase A-like enzyme
MVMDRREFIKTMGLGAAAASIPPLYFSCGPSPVEKPNIVLINVDDLGWTDVACFGSQYYETPNIDRMAAEGMKFTNAYAACAVCSPTRAAIMTGRYPARIGITDWMRAAFQYHEVDEFLPEDKKFRSGYVGGPDKKLLCPRNPLWMELEEKTIAEALKPAGYTSCHIGKWHLGAEDWYPEKQGFDYNYGGCDFGQPPTYFDPYYSDRYNEGDIPTLKPRKKGEYLTDREADEACSFIKKFQDRPFFLHMAHYAVHTPLQGKEELVKKYKEKTSSTAQKNAVYAAMVESVDHAVGRILDTLDELNLSKKTLVIFTSDNGGLKGHATDNSPLRSGKGFPYEGGIRIPQIIRWPGEVAPESICEVPVSSIDFLPTICEASRASLPEDRKIDGKSLMPLWQQKGDFDRDALFWHFPHYRGRNVVPYTIILSGGWKLIKRYEGKTYELFNLKVDISETADLSEERPDKVKELDVKLTAWLEECGAKIPKSNPDYVKKDNNL